MNPPLGWVSMHEAGIGPTYGTRFPQLGPDVSDSSCSTAGSEVAGQHYRGRRSEPRNHRSHHRDLGHYHFGDSDPADDLGSAAPRGRPWGSNYASTTAGGSALADLNWEAQASGLAVRSGVVTHTPQPDKRRRSHSDGVSHLSSTGGLIVISASPQTRMPVRCLSQAQSPRAFQN